jgi:hypothetical protein
VLRSDIGAKFKKNFAKLFAGLCYLHEELRTCHVLGIRNLSCEFHWVVRIVGGRIGVGCTSGEACKKQSKNQ